MFHLKSGLILLALCLGTAACSNSEARRTGSTDASDGQDTSTAVDARDATDGTDGTDTADATDSADDNVATDSTDSVVSSDAVDVADSGDSVDAPDGADAADNADATDGVDISDGIDLTDGGDGFDSTDNDDGHDSENELDGYITDAGCWVPSDTSGINCTPLCTAMAECNPDCETSCPSLFAHFATPELANSMIECASDFSCSDEEGAELECILEQTAPNPVPDACGTIANFLEGCQSAAAAQFTEWCTMIGPYLKPGVLDRVFDCFSLGCGASAECLMKSSCLIADTLQLDDAGSGGEGPEEDGPPQMP